MKRCCGCGETKPLEGFHHDRSRRDGRMVRCRDCENERSRRYYEANADRKLAAIAAKRPRKQRTCMHCDKPATSNRHWFCNDCRANGARRRRPPSKPTPPPFYCERGQQGCGMDHSDPAAPCRVGLTGAEMDYLYEHDPEGFSRWGRLLHPTYGRA